VQKVKYYFLKKNIPELDLNCNVRRLLFGREITGNFLIKYVLGPISKERMDVRFLSNTKCIEFD